MHSSILFLDFETRSVLNVADVGAHRYATDPTTEVTLLSYAFGSKPVRTCTSVSDEVREALEDQSVLKVAHNAEFDMAIAKYVCGVEINPMDWWTQRTKQRILATLESCHTLPRFCEQREKRHRRKCCSSLRLYVRNAKR